jgi:hypothetical protein
MSTVNLNNNAAIDVRNNQSKDAPPKTKTHTLTIFGYLTAIVLIGALILFLTTRPKPSYSKVINTNSSNLCRTNAVIEADTKNGGFTVSGTVSFGGTDIIRCYGAKLTAGDKGITLDEKTYKPGTLLTVDEAGKFIEVSSWN